MLRRSFGANNMVRLALALPDFAEELSRGLAALGYEHLAKLVYSIDIVERCPCSEPGCVTFYAMRRTEAARQVECDRVVAPAKGVLCVHYRDQQIVWIEALGRPQDRARLDLLTDILPPGQVRRVDDLEALQLDSAKEME